MVLLGLLGESICGFIFYMLLKSENSSKPNPNDPNNYDGS